MCPIPGSTVKGIARLAVRAASFDMLQQDADTTGSGVLPILGGVDLRVDSQGQADIDAALDNPVINTISTILAIRSGKQIIKSGKDIANSFRKKGDSPQVIDESKNLEIGKDSQKDRAGIGNSGNGKGSNNGGSGGSGGSNDPDFIGTSNGDVVDIRNMRSQDKVAIKRELRAAEISKGRLAKNSNGQDIEVTADGKTTGIDVIDEFGNFIQVGGPGKGTPQRLPGTIDKLKTLKKAAEKEGVEAKAFFEEGNSDNFKKLIEKSKKALGDENVEVMNK